jgi:hypothetical protein
VAQIFAKVAADLHQNRKVRQGGRLAREVFVFVLCRNASVDGDGSLPAGDVDAWYVADQLQISEAEAAEGLSKAVTAGLLELRDGRVHIVGWCSEWGRRAKSDAERAAEYRERHKPSRSPSRNRDARRDDRDEHRDASRDESDASRIERVEREEKREGVDARVASRPQPAVLAKVEVTETELAASLALDFRRRVNQTAWKVWQEHCRRHDLLRASLRSSIRPLRPLESEQGYRDLRARVEGYVELSQAEDDCLHVLAYREAEAVATGSLDWFGASVWQAGQFSYAKDRRVEDAGKPRQQSAPSPAQPQTRHLSQINKPRRIQ